MSRRHPKSCVLLIPLACGLIGCGGGADEATDLAAIVETLPRPAPRILLIGLDGADWGVARPLMDEGRLPTLASLVGAGASGELRSIEPMISPALWTSVVTGVLPEAHGIRDFVYRERGSYAQPIVNSSVRERLAVWNLLSALGLSVGVVDWYATWPAEEVNGLIVSDRIKTMGLEAEGVTYPDHATLEETLATAPPVPDLPALRRLRRLDPLPSGLDKALKEDLYRYHIAKSLYREHRPDFFAFYLKGLDAVGHFYWKYFDPDAEVFGEVDERETARLGPILPDYYELCDQLLGDFLREADDDTTVIVVSDHGFRAFGRPDSLIFDIDRLFQLMGLLEFEEGADPGNRSNRRVRTSTSSAWAHEGTKIVSSFGARDRPVYLNVAGRDPDGVIDAAHWPASRDEIVERLESLRTGRNTRVFSKVTVHDADARNPHPVRQEPDLHLRVNREIAFEHDLWIDGKPHSLSDLFLWEYGNISGSHRPEGILVARGPAIRPGVTIHGADLVDITPTMLFLVGAPVPDDLDGKVLRKMLAGSVEPSRLHLASYEDLVGRKGSEVDTTPVDEEYRERLRALGYVQ